MRLEDLAYIITAHSLNPVKSTKAARKWDKTTPYHNHPIWCATMIAHETSLEPRTREIGTIALLYHDIGEDTTIPIPGHLPNSIRTAIHHMTFVSSAEEMQLIWTKSQEIRLFKLYDKVSNWMDGVWMDDKKREKYRTYIHNLTSDVKGNYGSINITKIAEALT
jgi:hypothetical protein